MTAVSSLVRFTGWGEAVRQTLISVGTTAEKIDTLGASRIVITTIEANKILWVTPDDVLAVDSGIGLFMSSGTALRNTPCILELELDGDAPVWVTNGNASTLDISVLHFYGVTPIDAGESHASVVRIKGWGEDMKHTQHVVGASAYTRVDTLGAKRLLVMPIDAAVRINISPTDEGSNAAGLVAMRDNTTNAKNEPYITELAISGNAPVYLRGSGAGNVSVFHLYS